MTRFDATVVQAAGVVFGARSAFGALRARVAGTTELRRLEARVHAEAFLRELDLDPDLVLGPVVPRARPSGERVRWRALPRRFAWPAAGAAQGHA